MQKFHLLVICCVLLSGCGREAQNDPERVSPAVDQASSVATAHEPAAAEEAIAVEERAEKAPLPVGGDVTAPVPRSRVWPDFRFEPGKQYSLSTLVLKLVIDENGHVEDIRAMNHQNEKATPVYLAALKQWEFEPATLHGKPVRVIFNMTAGHFPVETAGP